MKIKIFESIRDKFGDKWVLELDNASPHTSKYAIDYLQNKVPYLFDSPAKSPDLSPIEQIWNYLKVKISNRNFTSLQEIYKALKE